MMNWLNAKEQDGFLLRVMIVPTSMKETKKRRHMLIGDDGDIRRHSLKFTSNHT